MIEKNWSPFVWRSSNDSAGSLEEHFLVVYSIQPHTIMAVSETTGIARSIHAEVSAKVARLAEERMIDAAEFHGGAGVARMNLLGHPPCYLGVFHFGNAFNEYVSWPYKF